MLRDDERKVARAADADERGEADEQHVVHHRRAVQPRGANRLHAPLPSHLGVCRRDSLRCLSRPAWQPPRVVHGAGGEVGERRDRGDRRVRERQ
eukprot:scaffold29530_cov71-Phaeocystis_antarctica.AAC.2